MLDAAAESPRVLKSPAPVCWITEFGESSVNHELRIWIADPESGLGNVQGEVFLRIWDKFKEAGIVIPYPQRDVHRSEEHTSELQSLMRISYAVFCLKKKKKKTNTKEVISYHIL